MEGIRACKGFSMKVENLLHNCLGLDGMSFTLGVDDLDSPMALP